MDLQNRYVIATLIIAIVIAFGMLIAASVFALYRINNARRQAEKNLRRLYEELEERVAERTAKLTGVNEQLTREAFERKQATQELERVKTALDKMAEGAQLIGFDWRYIYLNDAAAVQGRCPKEELVGHTIMEKNPGIEQTALFRVMQQCMETRMPAHIENVFTFPDNSTGLFGLSIQPFAEGIFVLTTDITNRKRAEAALRESQERFAKAFSSSPAALTITRLSDNVFVDVNENFLNLFEYSRAQVIGHASTEFAINPNVNARAELVRDMLADGAVHNREMVLYTKSGQARNMLMSVDPLELDGEAHVLTTMLDISSRKQTEAALQEGEAKLRALFQVLPVGVSILDAERNVADTNPALARILEISQQDLDAGEYSKRRYIHADGSTVEPQEFPSMRAFEEQRPVLDVEIGIVREGGETIWTSVSAVPLSNPGVMVVTTDITERKRTEATLAQERDLLQALMDNLPDTIYFKDTASRFTRINRAQARVLGVEDIQDALGKTDADFQAPHLASEFYEEEQRLLQTGEPVIARQELNPTPDGQSRWFSTTKVPMVDAQGRIVGLIGVSRDITERIKSEEAVIRVNAQLTERMREITFLNEMAEKLQACVTVQEVYQVTAEWASRLLPNHSGALYLISNSRHWVETGAAWGIPPPESSLFGLDDCWALWRGYVHVSGTGYPTVPCRHVKQAAPAFSICMPLLTQGETLGVFHLRVAHNVPVRPWNEAQQQLVRALADAAALALANLNLRETLRQQSIRDPLTNLFNRRYMEESLERELRRAERSSKCVGVMMLDADHFKKINDTQGHDAGDAVLRQLGHFLAEHTRGSDIACRYGGEEFTLILPEANLEQTRARAEQLRQSFKATPLHYEDKSLAPITLSFGVAAYPGHGKTVEEVLHAADTALYRAKHEGRDRVAVA